MSLSSKQNALVRAWRFLVQACFRKQTIHRLDHATELTLVGRPVDRIRIHLAQLSCLAQTLVECWLDLDCPVLFDPIRPDPTQPNSITSVQRLLAH